MIDFLPRPDSRRSIVVAQLLTVAAAGLLLAGCDKKPGGQVVAVVNNEEVTRQELKIEAQQAQIPEGTDPKEAIPALIGRVVDRNLLAEYARAEGLDRAQEYVARRRQLEKNLLATLALQKLAATQPEPTAEEVQKFIADNPTAFAERKILTLDQIRFATPTDVEKLKAITALPTIEAVAAKLTADGVKFERGEKALDTASIDTSVAKQIVALRDGEVFDISTGGVTFVNIITARRVAVAPVAEWKPAATDALKRQNLNKTLEAEMKRIRDRATIVYDPAFKPKAAAKAPAG
jgi:EpsD family peptidyl-prolyl cis-trans isomerase